MDKILSARVEEAVLQHIAMLAHRLHTSKKNVIETAVKLYAQKIAAQEDINILKETCGAWKRKESPETLVKQAKEQFRKSMSKHQK